MTEALDKIVCTAPWTLQDSKDLHAHVKSLSSLPCMVDVRCNDGKTVRVDIWIGAKNIQRTYELK